MAAEASRVPAQCHAIPQTGCWWSDNVCRQLVFLISQILTEPSPELVAKDVPSGLNSTADSQSAWPTPLSNSSPLLDNVNKLQTFILKN